MRSIVSSTGLAALLLVTACGATVRTSMAPNADPARYHTFGFYTPPYRQNKPESIADQTVRAAIRTDLMQKGLTEAAPGQQPDFLVAHHLKQQQELNVDTVGYGFWGWPGANVTEYTQGTLIVDFIDPQTHQVFWRGTATQVINNPEAPNMAKLDKGVSKIIARYPAQVAMTPRTTM
jgi:hypothetical protein